MVRERDAAFGQLMLQMRTRIGLTQAALAELLGVSRHAVGSWEAGESYPKADRLRQVIALAMQEHAFTVGQEAEEIRALWRAAHQKVLLDERWLHEVLRTPPATPRAEAPMAASGVGRVVHLADTRIHWDDAPDVPALYGRADELALLTRWTVADHCRVVSVLGLGGSGKSVLAATVMRHVTPQFDVVIWRSLRDAPSCDSLVSNCLQILAPHAVPILEDSLAERLHVLMQQLREQRVLLVLDNLESVLEHGSGTGNMLTGLAGYSRLLRQFGETAHQSCLLLTSREKPSALVALEGSHVQVRTLRLNGLSVEAATQLLVDKDVRSAPHEQARLVELYHGNPLALKIVGQTIADLFGGDIGPFLTQNTVVFGGVQELLDEQLGRLSALEQSIAIWLAILREPVVLEELLAVLHPPQPAGEVLGALDRLYRCSLIERGQRAGSFTLHSVVLDYATARLVAAASDEIEHGRLQVLSDHSLVVAQAKDYLRQTQEQLLIRPLISQLLTRSGGHIDVEVRLRSLLDVLRGSKQHERGYGPANLVTLLRILRGHLRALDLSGLVLRGAHLHGVEMQDTRLTGAIVRDSTFTERIDSTLAVAMSRSGEYWAAGSWRGDIRVWRAAGRALHLSWQAHSSSIWALAFSPDGRTLASGSWDNTVKLWDVTTGTLVWTSPQTGVVNCLAFSPDGSLLAVGGSDTLVQLLDPQRGTSQQVLAAEGGIVYALAWNNDGRRLASGNANGSVCVWDPQRNASIVPLHTLAGHAHWVTGLAFAPDGVQLASGSWDATVKLWNTSNGSCLATLAGHTDRILQLAWSADGRTVASCSFDQTIRLWSTQTRRVRAVLHGHTAAVYDLVLSADSRILLSGADDGSVRVWDLDRGHCVRTIGGYVTNLFDLAWSPDGTLLASGGADTLVCIWTIADGAQPRVLRGHRWNVYGVAWRPDGQLLASAGYDNSIRLWNPDTGVQLHVLRDADATETLFLGLAWSPDGKALACGSYPRGAQVWDTVTRTRRWLGQPQPSYINRVAWSPNGTRVAGCGGDGALYVWDAADGQQMLKLIGHEGVAISVAWSPDGTRLATGGDTSAGGQLCVWDAEHGELVQNLREQPNAVGAVVWGPGDDLLITGDSGGMVRWWNAQSMACIQTRHGHQRAVLALSVNPIGHTVASCDDDGVIRLWGLELGELRQTLRRDRPYERLDITGLSGITEAQRASLLAQGAVDERPTQGPAAGTST